MVAHGTLDIKTFFFFNVLVVMLVMPLRMLGMWIGQSQRATASGERIFEVMDEPEEITDRPDAADMPPGDGRVRYEHVSFEYAPGRPVLQDIDLELEPGRTVALIGHTGSGKTTLATLVPRFYDATRGPDHDRRRRRPRREAPVAAPRDRDRLAGSLPLLGHGPREHRASAGRTQPTRTSSGPRRSPRRTSSSHALPDGYDTDHRRARDHALGRPAPAARDRARADHGAAHPDPRRRDRLRRRDDRGARSASGCARR